jgi:D-glycero-beta-D-manno-heptose 1-phosphate adenylyltransferase
MLSKVLSADDAVSQVLVDKALADLDRPLVFTNGVFDILHRGHVEYLDEAAGLGASLIIGLNSDASARLLGKGPNRPHNDETDRAIVLSGLASVSVILMFNEPKPTALIARVRPDIYVKGGDYDIEALEETSLIRSWGGEAFAIPFRNGFSTSRLITRIRTTA